jgi:hypothetical protein
MALSGLLFLLLAIPVAIIGLVAWHVRRLARLAVTSRGHSSGPT